MEEHEFNKTMKVIISASYAIKDIYKKLAVLEEKGKKNNKEYDKLIKNLNIMQEIEEIYYQKLDKGITTYYDFIYEFDAFYLEQIDEDVMERISNHLIYRSEKATDYDSKYFYQKYYQKHADVLDINNEKLSIIKMAEIEKYFYRNVLNTYLYLLEMKSKQNKNIIKEKYKVFNMYKHMEKDFIKENFNAHEIYYFDTKTMAKYYNVDEKKYKKYLESLIIREFTSQLEDTLRITDEEFETEYSESKIESIECYFRALFTFMEPKTIDNLNYLFHEYIESDKFKKKFPTSNKSVELIIKSFKKIKKDRNKVKVLNIGIKPKN